MFCRASWDVPFHGSQCSSAFKSSLGHCSKSLKWFVMLSVYFVSINVCNCFSPSLLRRNTFLRTTLCLPCGPWFWLDRHWKATRCVRTFQTQHGLCWEIISKICVPFQQFSLNISLNFRSTGDRHDAKSTVWLFETQIRRKVSSLWPFKTIQAHPASFLIPHLSLQLYRLVFICPLRLAEGVCNKFVWPGDVCCCFK